MINYKKFPENKSRLYEIHLTINQPSDGNIRGLNQLCKSVGVKLITVVGQNDLNHTMITYLVVTKNKYIITRRIIELQTIFQRYNPTRVKIEIPANEFCIPGSSTYFESHIQIYLNNVCDKELNHEKLKFICEKSGFHLSKNIYKTYESYDIIMATHRTRKMGYNDFSHKISSFIELLANNNFSVRKKELEYCVYDTKEQMDNKWLNLN